MCQKGTVQTKLLEVMCIPVSLTVLGLVRSPEDTMHALNQSVEHIEIHDNSRITAGSDYKTVWCPKTVHKTIGHLGWSCRKLKSKIIEEEGIYLVEGTQNNRFRVGKLIGPSIVSLEIHYIIRSNGAMLWE